MKRVQLIRTHTSPYQAPDFAQREKNALEVLGITYTNLENRNPDLETVLVTNTHTELKALPPDLLNKTSLILHPNSGYDNFAGDLNLWKNIPLIVGHKIRAQAVAEYSLSCLFEALTELPQHLGWNKERRWERELLSEQNVTVIGNGHIGKIVANSLKAIGTKVQIVDPFVLDCYKSWKETKPARAVIVACGLNKHSHKMFNEDFFSKQRKDLIFINGARGKLVDEKALREFLLSNPEAFAFLDVFENEPFGSEWHSFPQAWKTSHIAGVSKNLDQQIIDFEVEVLSDFLTGVDIQKKYQLEILQNKFRDGILI
jgi:D-3-phosphoglycerate dehydrogenase